MISPHIVHSRQFTTNAVLCGFWSYINQRSAAPCWLAVVLSSTLAAPNVLLAVAKSRHHPDHVSIFCHVTYKLFLLRPRFKAVLCVCFTRVFFLRFPAGSGSSYMRELMLTDPMRHFSLDLRDEHSECYRPYDRPHFYWLSPNNTIRTSLVLSSPRAATVTKGRPAERLPEQ